MCFLQLHVTFDYSVSSHSSCPSQLLTALCTVELELSLALLARVKNTFVLSFKPSQLTWGVLLIHTYPVQRHCGDIWGNLSQLCLTSLSFLHSNYSGSFMDGPKAADIPIIWLSPLAVLGAGGCGKKVRLGRKGRVHLHVTPLQAAVTACGVWIWMTGFNKRKVCRTSEREEGRTEAYTQLWRWITLIHIVCMHGYSLHMCGLVYDFSPSYEWKMIGSSSSWYSLTWALLPLKTPAMHAQKNIHIYKT